MSLNLIMNIAYGNVINFVVLLVNVLFEDFRILGF